MERMPRQEMAEEPETSLGDMLRAAREARGLTLQDAEEATRIRAVLLEAMEAQEWDRFPARIYAKGQLQLYAGFLGLDKEEVMALFGETGEGRLARIPSLSEALARAPLVSPDLAAGLVLLVLLFAGGWLAFEELVTPNLNPASAPPPATEEAPVGAPPPLSPAPSPEVPAPLIVEFQILSRTWLQVTRDGELVFEGLLEAGTTQTWAARDQLETTIGDPAAVRVLVNGEDQGALGTPGEPLTIEWGVEEPPGLGLPTPTPGSTPGAAPISAPQ